MKTASTGIFCILLLSISCKSSRSQLAENKRPTPKHSAEVKNQNSQDPVVVASQDESQSPQVWTEIDSQTSQVSTEVEGQDPRGPTNGGNRNPPDSTNGGNRNPPDSTNGGNQNPPDSTNGGNQTQTGDIPTEAEGRRKRIPYMSSKKTLVLYDACKDTWVDTGLPFRAEPTFQGRNASRSLHKPEVQYRVGDKLVRLYDVDIYNLEKHVQPGKENVPKSFRGLWWMDGNPAPEIVLSFARAVYDKTKGTMTSLYNDQDSYIMQPSTSGIALWNKFRDAQVSLQVRIPAKVNMEDPQFGDQLFVDTGISKVVVQTSLLPTTYVSDQHWKRETGNHCYNFRKIVDENGKKLPVYDRFVKNVMLQTKLGFGTNLEVLVMPRYIE